MEVLTRFITPLSSCSEVTVPALGGPWAADKYAEVAMTADRYNPSALVNKGNVLYAKNDFEKAREFYKEALTNDSSCVEALYNLGTATFRH